MTITNTFSKLNAPSINGGDTVRPDPSSSPPPQTNNPDINPGINPGDLPPANNPAPSAQIPDAKPTGNQGNNQGQHIDGGKDPGGAGKEPHNNQGSEGSTGNHTGQEVGNHGLGNSGNHGNGGLGNHDIGNGNGGGLGGLGNRGGGLGGWGDHAAAGGLPIGTAGTAWNGGSNSATAFNTAIQQPQRFDAMPNAPFNPRPHAQPQPNVQPNTLSQDNRFYQGNSVPAQQGSPYAPPSTASPNPLPGTGTHGGLINQALGGSALGAQGANAMGAGAAGVGIGGAAMAARTGVQGFTTQNQPLGASALARPSAASPASSMLQGLANPRAEAAALAAQSKAGGQPGSFGNASGPAALAQMGKAAPATASLPNNAASTAAASMGSAAGAGRTSMGNAQAVAQAQGVLAQALGRTMAGQMTAGGAAVALAQAQLALQVALRSGRQGLEAAALQAAGKGSGAAQPASGARADVLASARPARPAATQPGPQVLARAQVGPSVRAGALGPAAAGGSVASGTGLAGKASGKAHKAANDAQAQAGAMPPSLALALAMAPKVRKRGSHERVERVERDTPRAQTPEMEDEDFWDGLGDADAQDGHDSAPAPEDAESAQALQALQQHYRAMVVWLAANERHALLRELAAGRSVLVLAPPDGSHTRLLGHFLRPDGACTSEGAIPGMTGRAWALGAQWSATMPADGQWREWRLRQDVDGAGRWRLGASRPDKHTPRVLVRGEASATDGPSVHRAPHAGECIGFYEPRRLRRLMAAQWTMLVLRVPLPLDGIGQVSAAA